MGLREQSIEKARGDARGSDPRFHAIKDDGFICTAPSDAPCRTWPTCECETWCCCDGSQQDAIDTHDQGEHCCMVTATPGHECWMGPWISAAGLSECFITAEPWPMVRVWDETGWPEGPVVCDWADGVFWSYAKTSEGVA